MMDKLKTLTILVTLILSACQSQNPTPLISSSAEPADATEGGQAVTTQAPSVEATGTTIQGSPTLEAEPQETGTITYNIVPGESRVTYEVGEVFINQNNRFNTAIGATGQITAEVRIDRNDPQNSSIGPIQVDISRFQSDSSRRDNAIRERFLQSALFPLATFDETLIEGLPGSYQDGQELNLQINGNLTIREVTNPITVETMVTLNDETLTARGETSFLMSDFGFGPIDIAGILKTEDEVLIHIELVAKP